MKNLQMIGELLELSSDPLARAYERMDDAFKRGGARELIDATKSRCAATKDPDKLAGMGRAIREGLKAGRWKLTPAEAEEMRGVAGSLGKTESTEHRPTRTLTEEVEERHVNPDAADLLECFAETGYGYESYRKQTFEEKLRHACGMLRDALQQEAMEGLGDDGRQLRQNGRYEDGTMIWQQIEKITLAEIYPDRFKALLPAVKAVVDANLE